MKREGCVGSARIVGGKHSISIDCLIVHVVDTARAVGGGMLSWLRCVGVRVSPGIGPIIQYRQEMVTVAGHNLDIVSFLYFCR